ncbi:TRAP transporter small permease [Bordetella muralis]|jgi:TRAP-type transport system small permease protein|uniref:TRAP transporter small permease n=1 Tax=Bordetella muralis TaxID=1649130 RepID=UPI0039EFBFB8
MKKLIDGYFRLLGLLMVLCLVTMVILVFGNVVLRYGFNSGITSSEEVSRWLFVWLVFLGSIVALRHRQHLGVEVVVRRLPVFGQKLCLIASQLLMLATLWLFLSGSWEQTVINLNVEAPATGWSMSIVYMVGIVFSVSAGAMVLWDLYRVLSGRIKDEELIMVTESEEKTELDALKRELAAAEGKQP